MELNLNNKIKEILTVFILIILPLLLLLVGLVTDFIYAWYILLLVTWFGMGVILYSSISD